MQVKICGITNEEDALSAARCGAAALGFVFYPPSKRYIEPKTAQQIISVLPSSVARVGVFVNEDYAEVNRIADYCELDFIQFHGDETPDFCRKFPTPKVIKAVFLNNESDVEKACGYNVAAILVDSRQGGFYGGTGITADWDLARRVKSRKPLILAGGLREDNVVKAIEKVVPHAVDINSGVEIYPGKKDPDKIVRLFEIINMVARNNDSQKIFSSKR